MHAGAPCVVELVPERIRRRGEHTVALAGGVVRIALDVEIADDDRAGVLLNAKLGQLADLIADDTKLIGANIGVLGVRRVIGRLEMGEHHGRRIVGTVDADKTDPFRRLRITAGGPRKDLEDVIVTIWQSDEREFRKEHQPAVFLDVGTWVLELLDDVWILSLERSQQPLASGFRERLVEGDDVGLLSQRKVKNRARDSARGPQGRAPALRQATRQPATR